MKSIKLLAILLFSALLFTGCSLKNNDVIVKVNDKVITQADYDKLFNQTINNPGLQMFGLNKKNVDKQSFMYLMIKDRVVSELIIRSLVNEEMEKRHITVTKADTDKELQNMIEKVGSKAKFNEILKQNGVTLAEFKRDLTEEELNSVYEGLESFDFQGVNALEDTERLDENLENFTNENWENLSIEEQKESMNDLAQYIIDVTGLENPPKIEFYNNDKEGDYGGFDRLNNTLSINEHMLYQNDEAADTVAHELWHALQYQRASNPQTRQDLMYAENFSNYISPSEDFEAYQSQILESEARAFAQQIKDRLASYSK